ncbi:MAG: aminodeoxychorismate synthase component I [Planctomycetota bacterium]
MRQRALDSHAILDFDSEVLPGPRLLFDGFDRVIATHEPAQVRAALEEVERELRAGHYAVGFLTYEAAPGLDPHLECRRPLSALPVLWFGLSSCPEALQRPAPPVSAERGSSGITTVEWKPTLSSRAYGQSFRQIAKHIRDGDTYQVNFTFALTGRFTGSATSLYAQLRTAQAAGYCAWIHTSEWDVLSASPELFFEKKGRQVRTRPMKGTRPRGMTWAEDLALAHELEASDKDRAENVMIVDLLRNDLGRLASAGTVRCPRLFDIERYPTVLQMTSTITAELRDGVGLVELFTALFPSGSVTGAPKIRTMQIVSELEREPRGVYCGTVGCWLPSGDAVFNVAIRTLVITKQGEARYGVGSGLVADSDPEREYDECLLKAQVLERAAEPPFRLLETMRYEPTCGIALLDRHLQRLGDSALYFGHAFERATVAAHLEREAQAWNEPLRIRLVLDRQGRIEIETAPLGAERPIRTVRLAQHRVNSRDPFLYHKTTHRRIYEEAFAERGEADDVLLVNERGEVTESTIANVALERDGVWVTPPLSCGLLGGTMRAELLEKGRFREGIIRAEELCPEARLMLFNSVRGPFEVRLLMPARREGP